MRADLSHNADFRAFHSFAVSEIQKMLRANVRCHDNQRIAEIHRAPLAIG